MARSHRNTFANFQNDRQDVFNCYVILVQILTFPVADLSANQRRSQVGLINAIRRLTELIAEYDEPGLECSKIRASLIPN